MLESNRATADEGALLIARDAYPALRLETYRARLDTLADRVVARLQRDSSLSDQLAALRTELYESAGLRGNTTDYYDARNSYINDVLDRGLGIPISLAVVILGVARRSGIVVEGIAFPGHFLVRLGGPGGPFADPFAQLRTLNQAGLDELAKRAVGEGSAAMEVRPSHLEPVSNRVILLRMLTNLHAIHARQKDHARALQVCDRLVELDAGPSALRDRGLHALALGAVGVAKEDLNAYLATAPNPPDRARIETLLKKPTVATIRWN